MCTVYRVQFNTIADIFEFSQSASAVEEISTKLNAAGFTHEAQYSITDFFGPFHPTIGVSAFNFWLGYYPLSWDIDVNALHEVIYQNITVPYCTIDFSYAGTYSTYIKTIEVYTAPNGLETVATSISIDDTTILF